MPNQVPPLAGLSATIHTHVSAEAACSANRLPRYGIDFGNILSHTHLNLNFIFRVGCLISTKKKTEMEPGTYITVAQVAFEGACLAVKAFRKGLNFNKDAERLVLGLEVERFRLRIWGENAGLAPTDGQPATLPGRLLPLCEILKLYLQQIEQLVKDADRLSDRYGLLPTQEPPTKSELVRRLVDRMQQSIHRTGTHRRTDGEDEDDQDRDGGEGVRKIETWKRVRRAIRDLDKFDSLVHDLAQRINKLNDLMTEAQQRRTREDNYRVNMVVVGSAVDEASLELIRAAVQGEPATSQVRAAIERKALSVADVAETRRQPPPPWRGAGTMALSSLSLDDFVLPAGFAGMKRFIAVKASGPVSGAHQSYYLLERKTFDADILPEDMARLTSRVQRLVMLLRKPKPTEFRTPMAEGCIKDPARFCWWVVFRFPLGGVPRPLGKSSHTPVSLLSLLDAAAKFRPPLELRIALAGTLCAAFAELYSSGWLHKGVRGDNILFPEAGAAPLRPPPSGQAYAADQMRAILASPLVCGFDYSRHESEWATIDKARMTGDVAAAIYRHPDYQGEAASGYKVQYDIYSLGLVLVEIALWVPLRSFLEAIKRSSSSRSGGGVTLFADMQMFHAPQAAELKRRVLARVESELAFRVGSPYFSAVKFCLEFADRQPGAGVDASDGGEVGMHPAMEFYDNVVVPLASLSA